MSRSSKSVDTKNPGCASQIGGCGCSVVLVGFCIIGIFAPKPPPTPEVKPQGPPPVSEVASIGETIKRGHFEFSIGTPEVDQVILATEDGQSSISPFGRRPRRGGVYSGNSGSGPASSSRYSPTPAASN